MLTRAPTRGAARCARQQATAGPRHSRTHYDAAHTTPTPTYLDFLREARNEHGLRGERLRPVGALGMG
jgi:hypothetical protein